MGKSEVVNFKKTLGQLQAFLGTPVRNDRDRAGVIQAFEFTYEQAWKSIQKISGKDGVPVASPKQAFSYALQTGWLQASDEPAWLAMMSDRNLTSHTYKEDLAIEVLGRIEKTYLDLFKGLLSRLERA